MKAQYSLTVLLAVLLIAAGCTSRPGPAAQPMPVEPAPAPVVDTPQAPASEPAPVSEPPAAPNPAAPDIPVMSPDQTPPSPADNTPHPGPNEIWIVGNSFVPDFIGPSEGVTFSIINKNDYTVTIVPSTSSSNGAIYQDPATGKYTVNGYSFTTVLPPGGASTLTLITGGPFIIYLQSDPSVTALIRVGT